MSYKTISTYIKKKENRPSFLIIPIEFYPSKVNNQRSALKKDRKAKKKSSARLFLFTVRFEIAFHAHLHSPSEYPSADSRPVSNRKFQALTSSTLFTLRIFPSHFAGFPSPPPLPPLIPDDKRWTKPGGIRSCTMMTSTTKPMRVSRVRLF